jgi:hypothetical protein
VLGTTAGFASSFFVSSRRQASVILADGSHYVPFATVAIRSFLTHCTLRPSARSGLFSHAQSEANNRLLMKKENKEKASNKQKKRSKDESFYRSVKARPYGFP